MGVKDPFSYSDWRPYNVYFTSFGFNCGYFQTENAPNRTWARRFVQGTLNPGCKVIRVVEATTREYEIIFKLHGVQFYDNETALNELEARRQFRRTHPEKAKIISVTHIK